MKKISLLALPLALLAFGSCDNNDNISNGKSQEIGITPTSEFKGSTRGYTTGSAFEEVTYENLIKEAGSQDPKDRVMTISSYLEPQHGESKAYFTKKTFKKDVSGFWRNHNGSQFDPIMWPIGGKLSFLAISTTEGFELSNALWNNENPTNSVEFDVTAEKCTQNDILFAGKYDVASKQENGNVDMTFKHAQAWLTFRLTGDMNGDKSIVHFKRIELEQAYNAGKLLVRRNENDVMAEWNLNSNTAGKVTVDNKRSTPVTDLTMTAQQLDMLVPQQQNCAFTLYYTLGSDLVENSYRFELPSGTWFMGQHYIYNIHITATEITVVPSVEPWGEQEYVQLKSDMFSMKAIGGATVGKVLVNGAEIDPMKLYKTNETLTISAEVNGDDHFRWEDSTTINDEPLKMTVKEFNAMENPIKVLFYTDKVIPFAYSVSATEKVYFASGNLYADRSSGNVEFFFEKNQYDFRTYAGKGSCINGTYTSESGTPANTSGLFQWDVTKAVEGGDFGAFGSETGISGEIGDVLNFGKALGEGSKWSTLTGEEWSYIKDNTSHNNLGQTMLSFADVKGAVLSPDSYTGDLSSISAGDADHWKEYESSGLVFLPAAGYFSGGPMPPAGVVGYFWSSSVYNTDYAYDLNFSDGTSAVGGNVRHYGCSVRLVWR